jgi:hypothetical protein
MAGVERRIGPNDEFHRRFVAPEERKERWLTPWRGDFRWFESDNVLPLEQYRSRDQWVRIRARLWPNRRTYY